MYSLFSFTKNKFRDINVREKYRRIIHRIIFIEELLRKTLWEDQICFIHSEERGD